MTCIAFSVSFSCSVGPCGSRFRSFPLEPTFKCCSPQALNPREVALVESHTESQQYLHAAFSQDVHKVLHVQSFSLLLLFSSASSIFHDPLLSFATGKRRMQRSDSCSEQMCILESFIEDYTGNFKICSLCYCVPLTGLLSAAWCHMSPV